MSRSLLEEYLDSVSSLPSRIQQNFATLLDLDHKRSRLHEELDHQVVALQQAMQVQVTGGAKRSRRSTVADASLEAKLEPYVRTCLQCSEDKVQLAKQTYDMVDKHIERLDRSLKKFEEEVKHRTERETRTGPRAPVAVTSSEKQAQNSEMRTPSEMDLPIDPNEPTYCTCNRVSFGEMIACDNEHCKIEWFHFECVGLSRHQQQKGKWYCPECSATRKRGR
eukprot:CAMPEP_0114320230 /NCGR_PEP_ID=MMETSP0059-20121206/25809_1 /TAXON_ID=36894 /ORGANISM="Pyramimonas parkeae, Strain CCMP726" /LENGTH=221 /DNA_ID=CAMNT_0001447581 /DNA_START=94 /DNA_END=759 /DNA_ORIENTATION=+